MTKAELENKLREQFLGAIIEMLSDNLGIDALSVSASELAVPCIDEERNDKWVIIKVSVPRGTRDGNGGYIPYDGEAMAREYAEECEEKAEKKAKAEAKKQAKIARDEKARAEKKALAEANKHLKELRKIPLIKEEDNA